MGYISGLDSVAGNTTVYVSGWDGAVVGDAGLYGQAMDASASTNLLSASVPSPELDPLYGFTEDVLSPDIQLASLPVLEPFLPLTELMGLLSRLNPQRILAKFYGDYLEWMEKAGQIPGGPQPTTALLETNSADGSLDVPDAPVEAASNSISSATAPIGDYGYVGAD